MYEKARRGESIELSPRRISIFKFDIERSLDDRYVYFQLTLLFHHFCNLWLGHIQMHRAHEDTQLVFNRKKFI